MNAQAPLVSDPENSAGKFAIVNARFPATYTIVLLATLFLGALAGVAGYLLVLEERVVHSIAVSDAAKYSEALTEFRTLYTSEVVERALAGGTRVTHDYLDDPTAIPLPATLSILLGNRINQAEGGRVRLYSDFPFPWRENESEDLDTFEWLSLEQLREDPTTPVFSFEEIDGESVLRYSTADLMRPSCVQCHNEHPSSPKRDWKVGDVRGVLEVVRPLEAEARRARRDLRGFVWLLVAFAGIGLGVLSVLSIQLRRSSLTSSHLVAETERVNQSLQGEILQRERAEQEQVALQEQVQYAQKLESLGLLAGGIAHDFNNLLSIIQGNSYLAEAKLPTESPSRRHLLEVQEGTRRAADLTRQLLVYAGRGTFETEPLDLGSTIAGILGLLKAAVPPNVTVLLELEENLPLVDGDASQLQQVVLNLVTNAYEACAQKKSTVRITTGTVELDDTATVRAFLGTQLGPGTYVFLQVSDTGSGLDLATRGRIFDPFYSTKGPGRGLGLATLLGIVNSHDGALELTSGVDEGTTFRVFLRCSDSQNPLQEMEVTGVSSKITGSIVLVVDDNESVLTTTSDMLELLGGVVVAAPGGKEAMEVIHRGDPITVVLLDMTMPGMTGEQTFRQLRAARPDTPVVLMSGYEETAAARNLSALPFVTFLSKPFTPEALEQAFATVLAGSDGDVPESPSTPSEDGPSQA